MTGEEEECFLHLVIDACHKHHLALEEKPFPPTANGAAKRRSSSEPLLLPPREANVLNRQVRGVDASLLLAHVDDLECWPEMAKEMRRTKKSLKQTWDRRFGPVIAKYLQGKLKCVFAF